MNGTAADVEDGALECETSERFKSRTAFIGAARLSKIPRAAVYLFRLATSSNNVSVTVIVREEA